MTLKQLAHAIRTTPQTAQRLEVGTMTVSLEWLYAIAEALAVPPSKLLIDPKGEELSADSELVEKLRGELIRARRQTPSIDDAPLALFETAGKLAGVMFDWQKGLRRRDEVVTACAATAAAAMRIALDAGWNEVEDQPSPQMPKLVVNRQ